MNIEKYIEMIPTKVVNFSIRVLLALVCFFLGMQIIKLIRRIVKKALTKANADVGVTQFLDSFIKTALFVVLLFMLAASFGLDTASVIAVLGSAGVAIGLALQGSLSNFAGGVLILLLKPFRVGDYIKEDNKGNEGTVIEIQMFYTKLATTDNRVVILPNGTLANTSMTNVTAMEKRRLDIRVGISYDADLQTAKNVLNEVLQAEEKTLKNEERGVLVDELGAYSVVLILRCWVKKDDYWNVRSRVTENAKQALDEAGIEIPLLQLNTVKM